MRTLKAFFVLSLAVAIGCSGSDEAGDDDGRADGVTNKCKSKLKNAIDGRINESVALYGERDTYGDILLARTAPNHGRKDFIAVTSRLNRDDIVSSRVCTLTYLAEVGGDDVPPLDDLKIAKPGATCIDKAEDAVLLQAKGINETASIVGSAAVYGNEASRKRVLVVRVTDEVEPSDYAVVVSGTENAAASANDCNIEFAGIVASGTLSSVPELEEEGKTCDEDLADQALAAARADDAGAVVEDFHIAYGTSGNTYGKVTFFRTASPDVEGFVDFVGITGIDDDNKCQAKFVTQVSDGAPPARLDRPSTELPDEVCQARIDEAVLEAARKINEGAHITGKVALYSGDPTMSKVVLVRVSDEVEPSDYAVVVESEDCVVEHLEVVGSGTLDQVPGLE